MTQYRQGDVLLIKVTPRSSARATPVPPVDGRVILAYGEQTGHAHAIDAALAELFDEHQGQLYLRVTRPGSLGHEEHAPIALEPGWYQVVHQREYMDGMTWRRVRD
jgi:uncharacterized membrane protein (UPF0182 family)